MRRRRNAMLWFSGLTATLVLALLIGLAVAVRHEPRFYREASRPDGSGRVRCASEFQDRLLSLGSLISQGDGSWGQEFTQDQLNGHLQENPCDHPGSLLPYLPPGVGDPRFEMGEDRLRIGVRYGRGIFSTVVSVDVRLWLVAGDANTVALELSGFSAGALPLGTRTLMEQISEAAHAYSIDVSWYRHGGNPVGILRLQADRAQPTFQLNRLALTPGKLVLAGRRLQDSP